MNNLSKEKEEAFDFLLANKPDLTKKEYIRLFFNKRRTKLEHKGKIS